MDEAALVYVVDDDQAVRSSLSLLMKSVGLRCLAFASAAEFLRGYDPERSSCLVADVRMPGMSGLELQSELGERQIDIPIVFITGYGDVPMAVEAMKAGAVDFIQKPFRDQELLDCINTALQEDGERRSARADASEAHKRLATLTPREAEVLDKVVLGCANKVIALDLGVSQRTVELHRARVMQKMGVRSVAELVRIVEKVR
jgi:two-component system, LuxR family, response regulator FixJ